MTELEREIARAKRDDTHRCASPFLRRDATRHSGPPPPRPLPEQAVAQVAQVLDGLVRRDELIASLDNDTFGWILVNVDTKGATAAAQRAIDAVADADFEFGELSLTVGIADSSQSLHASELLRLAQQAQQSAVAKGGDAVVFNSEQDESVEATPDEQRAVGSTRSRAPVSALMRTLDAVDSVASRHSERVGELAATIAVEMGWSETMVRAIRDAGCLHDIGMLCIPRVDPGEARAADRRGIPGSSSATPHLGGRDGQQDRHAGAGQLGSWTPRALGWLRLPRRPGRPRDPGGREHPCRCRRLGQP